MGKNQQARFLLLQNIACVLSRPFYKIYKIYLAYYRCLREAKPVGVRVAQ
jgi:hypothetical protein